MHVPRERHRALHLAGFGWDEIAGPQGDDAVVGGDEVSVANGVNLSVRDWTAMGRASA